MKRNGGWEYWEEKAADFDRWNEKIVGRETESLLDRWLLTKITKDDSVLELGCGTGRYSILIAETEAQLTSADQSPAMLEETRKKLAGLENVCVRREDCFDTSFTDSAFDVVFMGNLLHIVKTPENAVREAYRILKPGGKLLAIDYTSKGMSGMAIARMVFTILTTWGLPSKDNRAVAPEDLRQMAVAAGFEIREAELLGQSVKAVCLHAEKIEKGAIGFRDA